MLALVINAQMMIVSSRPDDRSLTGRSLHDIVALDLGIGLSGEGLQTLKDMVARVLRSGQEEQFREETLHETGIGQSVTVKATLIPNDRARSESAEAPDWPQDKVFLIAESGPWERVELAVAADRKNIRNVIQQTHQVAERAGFIENLRCWDAIRLRLATDEALQNAIEHGCHGNALERIHLTIEATTHRIQVCVRDPGDGFLDPVRLGIDHVSPLEPRGRGIVLMRFAANHVDFNPSGNQVTLTFLRSGR